MFRGGLSRGHFLNSSDRWQAVAALKNKLIYVAAPSLLVSESTSSRSLSTSVRKVWRKIRCANERSRRSRVCSVSSLHSSTVEFSLARADAERGMPHSNESSPRIVPAVASVSTKSLPLRSTKTSIWPARISAANSAGSPSFNKRSPAASCFTSPASSNRLAPFMVNPSNSGKVVINSAYCSLIIFAAWWPAKRDTAWILTYENGKHRQAGALQNY